MKSLTSSLLALALCSSTAMAADIATLSPGHPAGVRNAQTGNETLAIAVLGAAAVAGLVLVATSVNSKPIVVTSTSTTA